MTFTLAGIFTRPARGGASPVFHIRAVRPAALSASESVVWGDDIHVRGDGSYSFSGLETAPGLIYEIEQVATLPRDARDDLFGGARSFRFPASAMTDGESRHIMDLYEEYVGWGPPLDPGQGATLAAGLEALDGRVDALEMAGPGGGGGVTDHGALTGLADDDHPQYLTQVRGDARYVTPAQAALAAPVQSVAGRTGVRGVRVAGKIAVRAYDGE